MLRISHGKVSWGLWLTSALSLMGGCQDLAFEPSSYLTGLRLLAVKAEPAEVDPGAPSELTALVYNSEADSVEILWDACHLAPPAGSIIAEDCITNPTAPYLEPLGAGEMTQAVMPNVTVEQAISEFGSPDYTMGFYLPVRLRAITAAAELSGVYRLRYHLPYQPPNHNPVLVGLFLVEELGDGGVPDDAGQYVPTVDGGSHYVRLTPVDDEHPLALTSGDKVTLRVEFTPESAETYYTFKGDPLTTDPVAVTEILRASWYATGGSLSVVNTGLIKPDNVLTLDLHVPPAGSTIDLFVVGREERGGTTWLHRTIQVN